MKGVGCVHSTEYTGPRPAILLRATRRVLTVDRRESSQYHSYIPCSTSYKKDFLRPVHLSYSCRSLVSRRFNFEMQEEDEHLELLFENLGLRHFGKMQLQPNLFAAHTFLFVSIFVGVLFSYSAFISKLMPDTGILVLDFMKHDYYFCYLFPLMLLPTYIVVYINWLAMKFFKNNWNFSHWD